MIPAKALRTYPVLLCSAILMAVATGCGATSTTSTAPITTTSRASTASHTVRVPTSNRTVVREHGVLTLREGNSPPIPCDIPSTCKQIEELRARMTPKERAHDDAQNRQTEAQERREQSSSPEDKPSVSGRLHELACKQFKLSQEAAEGSQEAAQTQEQKLTANHDRMEAEAELEHHGCS
jgi:hypothetical protein